MQVLSFHRGAVEVSALLSSGTVPLDDWCLTFHDSMPNFLSLEDEITIESQNVGHQSPSNPGLHPYRAKIPKHLFFRSNYCGFPPNNLAKVPCFRVIRFHYQLRF